MTPSLIWAFCATRSICANVGPEDSPLLIEVGDTSASFELEVQLPRYLAAAPEVWLSTCRTTPTRAWRVIQLEGWLAPGTALHCTSKDGASYALRPRHRHRPGRFVHWPGDAAQD